MRTPFPDLQKIVRKDPLKSHLKSVQTHELSPRAQRTELTLCLAAAKHFIFERILFPLFLHLIIFSISPILGQAFPVTPVLDTHFFLPAETIISCYCRVPFPLKATKMKIHISEQCLRLDTTR